MDDEIKGSGNSLDFGERVYDSRLGKWFSVDPMQKEYSGWSPYNFVRGNPILKLDILGEWDIEVHVFNNRAQMGYGILVVKDKDGIEVARYKVRAEGVNDKDNQGNKRNRLMDKADTPLGVYDITGWMAASSSGELRKAYGPNARLALEGVSGEIKTSRRTLIRVHGGRQETETKNVTLGPNGQKNISYSYSPIANAELKVTEGCMRIKDADIASMKRITDGLQINSSEETPGNLKVVDDLRYDREANKYYTPDDFNSLTQSRQNIFWGSGSFTQRVEEYSNNEKKGIE